MDHRVDQVTTARVYFIPTSAHVQGDVVHDVNTFCVAVVAFNKHVVRVLADIHGVRVAVVCHLLFASLRCLVDLEVTELEKPVLWSIEHNGHLPVCT